MSYRIFNTLVFGITNQCNSKCSFCIVKSGSKQEIKRLDEFVIKDVLQEISKINVIKTVAFTGGEVFEDFDKLVRISKIAHENNKNIAIYTNGFWCYDYPTTLEKLKILQVNGLTRLLTSIDYEHQKYIPLNYQKCLLKACNELGILINVHSVVQKSTINSTFDILKELGNELIGFSVTFSSVMPFGEAEFLKGSNDLFNTINIKNARCSFDNMAYINPNGDVYPCCMGNSPEQLLLGNIYKDNILDCLNKAIKNSFFMAFLSKGLEWVLDVAKEENLFNDENLYTSSCEMCKNLLSDNNIEKVYSLKRLIEKKLI